MAAAGDSEEGRAGQGGEERGPGREFVGVVGDDEGAGAEEAVVEAEAARQRVVVGVLRVGLVVVVVEVELNANTAATDPLRLEIDHHLRHKYAPPQPPPHLSLERIPRLPPPRIEPPPLIPLATQHIDQHPIPAPDIHKSRKPTRRVPRPAAVEVGPQLDQERSDAEVLEDVFGGGRLLGPAGDQAAGVAGFEGGVGVLQARLGDELVVVDAFRVAGEGARAVFVEGGEEVVGGAVEAGGEGRGWGWGGGVEGVVEG